MDNEYSIMKEDENASDNEQEYLPTEEEQELLIEGYEIDFDKKVSLMPAELVTVEQRQVKG